MYKRHLDLTALLKKNHYFLFGPRATGKSSLVRTQLPKALVFNLLDDDIYEEFLRRPKALSEQVGRRELVVIDEIQKLPKLLDEVHRLIEENGCRFLLTGSSARKLRRGGANMLGGRAREAHLFPLTFAELGKDFELIKYLNFGGLPLIYKSEDPIEDLKAYCRVYLSEEIKAEAAVRNYERFVRFLEVMALSNGREINYQKISRDCGIPPRTLEGHIEVLSDTLIGFTLPPYQKTIKRKSVSKSKFYFFDTGVANFLAQKLPMKENHTDMGYAFEQFIVQEVRAYLSYNRINKNMYYWRTGPHEVDLIIGDSCAIEIKYSTKVKDDHFSSLRILREEKLLKKYYVVGRYPATGESDGITYLNYAQFLDLLWSGKILQGSR